MDQTQKDFDTILVAIRNQFILVNHLYHTKASNPAEIATNYKTILNDQAMKLTQQLHDLSVVVARQYQVIFSDVKRHSGQSDATPQ